MSNLLLDEEPLLILPQLATKIGLPESIILQQIHYWNKYNQKTNNNLKDGYYWTFNSYEQWQEQFPFWNKKTIQRIINNLEYMGLVVSSNYNKMKIDKTKWYRIDHNVLETIANSHEVKKTSRKVQKDLSIRTKRLVEEDKKTRAIPKTNPKTNPKINTETKVLHHLSPNDDTFIAFYLETMQEYGLKSKGLTTKNYDYILNEVKELKDGVDLETWEEQVLEHFENLPKGNDGDILPFLKASRRYFG